MQKILVAICSYKRPKLLYEALLELKKCTMPENANVRVLVVDNDTEETAKEAVSKAREDFPVEIIYAIEPERGLAQVRNRVLKEAIALDADYIACFDDDDIPDKNWLNALWTYKNQNPEAKIVTGPTIAKFDKDYPRYITMNFRTKTSKKTGIKRPTAATGNVLMPVGVAKDSELYFNPEFRFMGGEDGEFFQKASDRGYTIVWCSEAVIYERINADRANIQWILNRYFYNGFSGVFFRIKNDKKPCFKVRTFVKSIFYVMLNLLILPFSVILGPVGVVGVLSSMLKNAGKITAIFKKTPLDFYKSARTD